jgi:transitional endoplasmic reticulum ATPase
MKKHFARTKELNAPGADPAVNLLFTRSACARWGAGILTARPTLDRNTLAFAFWVCGENASDRQPIIDALLSPADQDRLGLEIKQAWENPEDLAQVVGTSLVGLHGTGLKRRAHKIRDILQEAGRRQGQYTSGSLAANLRKTGILFGLDTQEVELCFFLTAMNWWEGAHDFFDHHLGCDRAQNRHLLMAALGFDSAIMSRVLSGKLSRIGILESRRDWLGVEDEFKPFFVDPAQAPVTQDLFRELPAAGIESAQLGVDPAQLFHLQELLRASDAGPLHILLYGPPGTGKTTLARALLGECHLKGLEVLGLGESHRHARRAALAACLEMAAGQPDCVVVVDEADGLLSTDTRWFNGGQVMNKAWLNSVLEQGGMRGIWIVNSTDGIDPAVKRRFTHSMELPPLDGLRRGVMLDRALRRHRIKRFFTDEQVTDLARRFELAPAVFETAVATAARLQGSARQCRQGLARSLEAKARLLGVEVAEVVPSKAAPFLMEGVNPEVPVARIIERARAYEQIWSVDDRRAPVPPFGLLFHGAPGTGKTHLAGHLAELLGRPLLSFRASDLLDPYVGMTERRIAGAFAQAAGQGGVLLLDEVDTFLGARDQRSRSWEVSRVNELLVQIEQHRGMFICTTNRLDVLDGAALRRFPVKVRFDALTGDQVVAVYRQLLEGLARGPLPGQLEQELRAMIGVTCADLVLVRRNLQLLGQHPGQTHHATIIADIQREVALKKEPTTGRVIGF